jgi:hypothetical protein
MSCTRHAVAQLLVHLHAIEGGHRQPEPIGAVTVARISGEHLADRLRLLVLQRQLLDMW